LRLQIEKAAKPTRMNAGARKEKRKTTTWHDDSHLPIANDRLPNHRQDAQWAKLRTTLGKRRGKVEDTTERPWACTIGLSVLAASASKQKNGWLRDVRSCSCTLVGACLLLASLAGWGQEKKSAPELVVAAAADLSSALQEISDGYEKKTGVKVKLSFGASGALTQQIQNGAPFDLFFSADMDYPRQLMAAGAADGASLYQYAVGRLVLWVPADSPLDVEHGGMKVLLDPSVKKIAIANPQHAPYGRAAMAALKHYGLYDQLSDRLVLGENISQAAQFVESGNAQAGIMALAHARAPAMKGKGKYWEIPADAYPPLAQGVVVLSRSPHKKQAADFLDYIRTKQSAEQLRKYGFTLPQS
jgi:molybdate transport system substrate-binding protein